MNTQEAPETDSLLLPFLRADDEQVSQRHLEQLLAIAAEPVLNVIVGRKLQPSFGDAGGAHLQEIEDVCGEVRLQLLSRLRDIKAQPDEKPISNFRGYVAVIAFNACNEHLRQRYPQRYRLRNRLRYLVTHNPAFGLWESDDGEMLCGLAQWTNKRATRDGIERLRRLRNDPQAFERSALARHDLQRIGLAELLTAVFEATNAPIELDDLVNAVAEWSGVKDQHAQPNRNECETDLTERLSDSRVALDVEVEQRMYVARLWSEICELPPRQRLALLLNLKDAKGSDCVALFLLSGITTASEIAASLAMSAEEFCELWNELPLDDATIAGRLGINRQQVINLRKSARERLARRMRAFEEGR
jgi:RNA polymerase sigma factor (sigma-70 family)